MRRLYILLAAALIAATLLAVASGGAGAQTSGCAKKYVAFALAPSIAWSMSGKACTKSEAKNLAMRSCWQIGRSHKYYRNDCEPVQWVKNGWGATAFERTLEGPPFKPSWGAGYGHQKGDAQYWALKACKNAAHESCRLDVWERSVWYTDTKPTESGTFY